MKEKKRALKMLECAKFPFFPDLQVLLNFQFIKNHMVLWSANEQYHVDCKQVLPSPVRMLQIYRYQLCGIKKTSVQSFGYSIEVMPFAQNLQ